jgi:hypothetical protein
MIRSALAFSYRSKDSIVLPIVDVDESYVGFIYGAGGIEPE